MATEIKGIRRLKFKFRTKIFQNQKKQKEKFNQVKGKIKE
jgi:hypothetical protein